MRKPHAVFLSALLAICCIITPASAATPPDATVAMPEPGTERALAAAAADLCPKKVALIGENGFHGDGRTMTFKAALVERLIRNCGFDAVFFEASHYDFITISRAARKGQNVSQEMVSSAIGGIWNKDRAIGPLVADLTSDVNGHRLTLGGLDDQLGSRGAFYSVDRMPADLAGFLPRARAEKCRKLLSERIHYQVPEGVEGQVHHRELEECLAAIRHALTSEPSVRTADRGEFVEMIDSIMRNVGRDGEPVHQLMQGRDRSMFINFQWLAHRLRPSSKIIVWAENAHVGNDAGQSPDYSGGRNFGSYIRQAYGSRAFSLGFTAAGGTFRWSARQSHPIPPVAADSLEGRVSGEGEAVYLGPRRLMAFGRISSGGFGDHVQVVAPWYQIYDGMIVFRTEHPPERIDE